MGVQIVLDVFKEHSNHSLLVLVGRNLPEQPQFLDRLHTHRKLKCGLLQLVRSGFPMRNLLVILFFDAEVLVGVKISGHAESLGVVNAFSALGNGNALLLFWVGRIRVTDVFSLGERLQLNKQRDFALVNRQQSQQPPEVCFYLLSSD